jgi:HAD superfamily hydrolase (TIGR01509 family)
MSTQPGPCIVKGILFDFGGVLAEEGFFRGLTFIAQINGLDQDVFFNAISLGIYESGYLEGRATEQEFWEYLESLVNLPEPPEVIRKAIMDHFVVREWMLEIVDVLREAGVLVAMLSDQTNWLEELNQRYGFYTRFDRVFNSYRLGTSKYRPATYGVVLAELGLEPRQTLFVDDNPGHVRRASDLGLKTILYSGKENFLRNMAGFCPDLLRTDL